MSFDINLLNIKLLAQEYLMLKSDIKVQIDQLVPAEKSSDFYIGILMASEYAVQLQIDELSKIKIKYLALRAAYLHEESFPSSLS